MGAYHYQKVKVLPQLSFGQLNGDNQLMNDEPEPAGFPNTDTDEADTQRILLNVIHPDRVKLEFETRDKYPNRDGFIEIANEDEIPIGDLVIQVKKLNQEYTDPPKFPAKVKTLIYARAISPPLLILGVDVDEGKVYWKHISRKWLQEQEDDLREQKTKTIHFSEDHVLDGENRGYISEWENIAVENKEKIKNLDEYKRLKKTATPALGKESPYYPHIHRFLDEYNRLRSVEFEVIQRWEADDVWSYGYVDGIFEDDQVLFGLYPIPSTVNDVQIKEIDRSELVEMDSHRVVRVIHQAGNPLKSSPEEYAKSQIKDRVEDIIENQNLDLSNSNFLVREVVFDFVDEHHEIMGLEKQDEYETDELYDGFFYYLQNWLDTAISSFAEADFRDFVSYGEYLSPVAVTGRLREEKMEEIHEQIDGTEGELQYLYPIGTHRYSPQVLAEAFDKVSSIDDSIERPYLEPDEVPDEQDSWYVWEGYSQNRLLKNVERVWSNLPTSYNSIVRSNFPEVQDDLIYFDKYSKIVIQVNNSDSDQRPSETRLFLSKKGDNSKVSVEVVPADEAPDVIDNATPGDHIEVFDEEYTVETLSVGEPVFFADKPPVLSESCSRLEDQIDDYFSDVSSHFGRLIPNAAAQSDIGEDEDQDS